MELKINGSSLEEAILAVQGFKARA